MQAVQMVLANVRTPAEQHHLLRAVATAGRPRGAATGEGVKKAGSWDVLALASDLEAGRPVGEPRLLRVGIGFGNCGGKRKGHGMIWLWRLT